MRKIIVAIDFDGTVVKNNWPGIGEPIPGAIESLRALQKQCQIILWTCRTGRSLQEAVNFLKNNGITDFLVNRNIPNLGFETSNKIFADVYVDDKSFFSLDWKQVRQKIEQIPNVEIRTK